ncbi:MULTISPECIES: TIM barrel protein [Ensifer]|uniref:sugar phosphate isomerase/epimerase family protein n=1 Tax=Ensifer TaxID=106591 RepID=UPI00070C5BAC|nr:MULTISPECIES: TIM barrel protein [Ensifer]KQU97823.1 myo-inositol catabolism protein [Ensifer sp. Root31]KQW54881.1 myo-inositol catabolism protein [Ensifer sp. Root127]KQW61628.1 myo-inositol catabolism protein [Ensifer sp. Root1252]KRC54392.1 myo-inositol catabolism protein [Ensifer sp. Root231]KRD01727.1 myo-inositol catabolism protein [Ensifer sp. Root258]
MNEFISAIGFCNRTGKGDLSSLDASLREIADTGADACEIGIYGEEIISRGRLIEDRLQRVADITRKYRFKKLSLHGQIVSNFMDRQHHDLQKKVVRAMLELCDRLGAGILVHHSGAAQLAAGESAADLDKMERDALAEMSDIAKGYGVRIALENIFTTETGQYRQTPSQVAETVRSIGSDNVVALIDFSHAYIEATHRGLDFREQLRAMAPVAGHLHVHDSFGLPYSMNRFYHPAEATALGIGDLHLPIGWGDIPWDDIFAELIFLPDTALIMEINAERFADQQPASLERARRLATVVGLRSAA